MPCERRNITVKVSLEDSTVFPKLCQIIEVKFLSEGGKDTLDDLLGTLGGLFGEEPATLSCPVIRLSNVRQTVKLIGCDVYAETAAALFEEPMLPGWGTFRWIAERKRNPHRYVTISFTPKMIEGFGCHIAATP
jgi:hypothetical protein